VIDCSASLVGGSKLVTVTNPDLSVTTHRFGILYQVNDGRMLGTTTTGADGALLRSEAITYLPDADVPELPFHGVFGNARDRSDPAPTRVRPTVSRVVEQDGRRFIWEVARTCGTGSQWCFDGMGRPTRVNKRSEVAP
jgi:hypothetical protein